MNDVTKDLQTETGTDSPHVDRKMVLRSQVGTFDLVFRMPKAINNALNSEDWDFVETKINEVFPEMVVSFYIAGETLERCMLTARRNVLDALYRRFSVRQGEAGNAKWLVPASMQDVRTEEELI